MSLFSAITVSGCSPITIYYICKYVNTAEKILNSNGDIPISFITDIIANNRGS